MGVMTFHIPAKMPHGARAAVDLARFAGGYDHTPFPSDVLVKGEQLTLTRSQNESGYVTVPWPVDGVGFPVTTSATLRERAEPYRLLVELARGKVNQVRSQVAEWDMAGVGTPADTRAVLLAATKRFGTASLDPNGAEADAAAGRVLADAYAAADKAVAGFADSIRGKGGHRPQFGCRIGERPAAADEGKFLAAFTAARLTPNWPRIEPQQARYDWSQLDDLIDWAARSGLRPSVGPLIDLGGPLPAWLNDWRGDPPSLAAYFCDFVETAVDRYRKKVTDWVLCSGFNHTDALGLAEDDRLRLAARLLDAARAADPDARWVVGLAQPWGDYLDNDKYTYSPLVFADTLLRSGLPVAGFELELIAGLGPNASRLRDRLDAYRLFDLFSVLGVPIEVVLKHPGKPPASDSSVASTIPGLGMPTGLWNGSEDAAAQAVWGERMAHLGLSLPTLKAVYWGQWDDTLADPSGLVPVGGGPLKPLYHALARVRQLHLG
jgi:hypothetical protein